MNHKYTTAIFERLNKGEFICSNSTDSDIVRLYDWIDTPEHYEELFDHFGAIGFTLEKGDEFYYFSKKYQKADLERKIDIAFKWIDLLDFFKSYDNSFGPGYSLSPGDIFTMVRADAILQSKADSVRSTFKIDEKAPYEDVIEKMIDVLVKDGFAEVESEAVFRSYKVLTSIKYLEILVNSINIPEEYTNEIP